MNYYSQFGQDKYLNENFFHNKSNGTYVDIGAHDGITGSNTYFFDLLGWEGICFEPLPEIYNQLVINRKRPRCYRCAISNNTGDAEFLDIKGYSNMLSGLIGEYPEEHMNRIFNETAEHPDQQLRKIKVHTAEFNESISFNDIDLLSIDTEGSEETILRSIDYDLFKIKFIVAEFNYESQSIRDFLYEKGFGVQVALGVDLVFKNIKL